MPIRQYIMISFIFVAVIIEYGNSVKINHLQVPQMIEHGKRVLLDCDFTLEENDQDLVVKWYFNKTLVYQWIPSKSSLYNLHIN